MTSMDEMEKRLEQAIRAFAHRHGFQFEKDYVFDESCSIELCNAPKGIVFSPYVCYIEDYDYLYTTSDGGSAKVTTIHLFVDPDDYEIYVLNHSYDRYLNVKIENLLWF